MQIDGWDYILSSVSIAKELHDAGRHDVMAELCDTLCWDYYYENIFGTIRSIFSDFHNNFDDEADGEVMVFQDDLISSYFVKAWEYGKAHRIAHDNNPLVSEALIEVRRWLSVSSCIDWKLLARTRTKKLAQTSKIIVRTYPCECNGLGHLAFGLIQLYIWFSNKCAEFKAFEDAESMDGTESKIQEGVPRIYTESKPQEVMAA